MAEIQYTPAILQRIETERRERVARLAGRAHDYTVTPDTVIPGAWIVRNPRIPGLCEIVLEDGSCSCRRSRIWGRCKHAAIVETRHGEMRTR